MGSDDSFTVSRTEFRRLWAAGKVRFENEHIDSYDQYDWTGRRWRRWLSMPDIGAVRWDHGDPGDEQSDSLIRETIAEATRNHIFKGLLNGE